MPPPRWAMAVFCLLTDWEIPNFKPSELLFSCVKSGRWGGKILRH